MFTASLWLMPPAVAEEGVATRPAASTAFFLFELPSQVERRTFVNLGIVQYVELRPNELRVYFGGGNLGSGHEFRVPLDKPDDGAAYLRRMQARAAECAAK